MSILELIGVVVGLIYLYLEYHANIWLWAANIVMPAIYIFVYHDAGFYADMGINIYYLIISIYGWYKWRFVKTKRVEKEVPITHTPIKMILPLIVVTIAVFVAICYVLINFTDSTVPYGDSFTTAVSIVGMWMLARKFVEQWLVWLVVDVVCVALYVYKGLYPTAGLYALYSAIAVVGYVKWLKLMKQQNETDCIA
ncbi:MAG: nicotinamide mononucleotide transporter [Tidjanibacter sp.]|nr:nicotinamide mononucleotide transporter [Tidjanibacter sp.]MBR6830943.1 nicotinamide mononucleotide transporter [Tidjanibacter sp.]